MVKVLKWRNKAKLSVALTLSILIIALISYQYGLSTVPAAGPYYLDVPFGDASYYVGKFDNGSAYMIDVDTWRCTWDDVNNTAVINAALGNLTSGRVWPEKVLIQGNYTGLYQIQIPNYTIVEVCGKLQAKANLDKHFVTNNDHTNGNINIELYGGIIDGNGDSQTADMDTIYFKMVSYSSVHDVYVFGGARIVSDGEGIEFDECTYCDIYGCKFETYAATYDPIKLTASSYCTIDANILYQNSGNSHGSMAIQLATSSYENVVSNNIIYAQGGNGIKMHTSHRNVISGNLVTGTPGDSISMIVGSDENLVIGNTLLYPSGYNGWGAITIREPGTAADNVIESNYIKLRDLAASRGIVLDENALRTRIIGNTIIGNGAGVIGINITSSATDTYIEGNDLSDSTLTTKISDSGTGTIIRKNRGYKTSGVFSQEFAATGSQNVTVTHDLSITPDLDDCVATLVCAGNISDWYGYIVCLHSVNSTAIQAYVRTVAGSTTLKLVVYITDE